MNLGSKSILTVNDRVLRIASKGKDSEKKKGMRGDLIAVSGKLRESTEAGR